MAGLLGFTLADLSGAVDSRKRQYGNLVRGLLSDPAATVAQLQAQDAEAAQRNRYTQASASSVMPEVAQQGQEAVLNAAMNAGGLLGITAYHGSPHTFDKFAPDAVKTTAGGLNKYGTFLSPDKKTGARYAKDFGGDKGKLYQVDADIKKPLPLSASEYSSLQRFVSKIDSGEPLNEVQMYGLEDMLAKHGVKPSGHPVEAIKNAGFDAITSDAGKHGMAEREILVFDPQKLKILSRE
jgi:hypothetical protein